MFSKYPIFALVLIALFSLGLRPVSSDSSLDQAYLQTSSNSIIIEGPIQSINGNVIAIANINIVLDASDPLLLTLQVGTVVEITSQVNETADLSALHADSVVVTGSNIVSPIITLQGPVQAVNVNIVTIFSLNIQFNPNDPILTELNQGDVLEVSGNLVITSGTSVVVPVQVVFILNVPSPEAAPNAGGVLINSFIVGYGGRSFDGSQTTFIYYVSGTGTPPDLSHFDVEIVTCNPALQVVGVDPTSAVSFGVDPTTGVSGIKWDLPLPMSQSRTYRLTFAGDIPEGVVTVAVKGGNGFGSAQLPGAGCGANSVEIQKYVSVDGATWNDADTAPGPEVDVSSPISFRFVVTNTGQTPLSGLALSDDVYDLSSCPIPTALAAGAVFECVIDPVVAEAGQHMDTATINAMSGSVTVTDSDSAFYFGGDRPSIDVEKFVSTDSSNWQDADTAPGLQVEPGGQVYFRFAVTNNGNVPLTNIALSDDAFDTSSCILPTSLEPGTGFECVIGPFPAAGVHTDTATVTALYQTTSVSDTDSANYTVNTGEIEGPVTIIIEGPIQAININIITIFNINIEVDPNDPILTQIHVGDVIRVEGNSTTLGSTIIIVAVNIVIINIDYGGDTDTGGPVVQPPPDGFSKDDCKKGGWQNLSRADGNGFKNQGDCIQYVNTGK